MCNEQGIEELWDKLDVNKRGCLSPADLKQGLRNIGHPLQSADGLMRDVFDTIDIDHDGNISRESFRLFVQNADAKLGELFKSLQKEPNHRVSTSDLRKSLEQSNVNVSDQTLNEFFSKVDSSHQGSISYEQWRNFLVFPPTRLTNLDDAISYYSRTLKSDHAGEVYISEESIQHLGYFAAGGIASITSRTLTAPLDRLKIYLIAQTRPSSKAMKLLNQGSPFRAISHALHPMKEASLSLWAAGGVRSLWTGNGLNLVKMLPEGAIKFGFYEASKRFFARLQGVSDPTKITPWAQFASGGLGGIAAQFTAYPIDTLRFRMQCELVKGGVHGNQLVSKTARQMWASGGVRSFYRGLFWGLVGQFAYSAIDLTTFEYTKRWLVRRNEGNGLRGKDAQPGAVAIAAIGGFSGAFGASVVWPLNMLRTRLQTQGTVVHPRTYNGIVDVTRQTLQGEGVRGLFRGITPNLIKVVPAVSITYVVYDKSKHIFGLE